MLHLLTHNHKHGTDNYIFNSKEDCRCLIFNEEGLEDAPFITEITKGLNIDFEPEKEEEEINIELVGEIKTIGEPNPTIIKIDGGIVQGIIPGDSSYQVWDYDVDGADWDDLDERDGKMVYIQRQITTKKEQKP